VRIGTAIFGDRPQGPGLRPQGSGKNGNLY
jgi:hypothetical protein